MIYDFIFFYRMYFIDKYSLHSSDANFISSLVYFISIVGCPVIGFLIDRTGYNLYWCKNVLT